MSSRNSTSIATKLTRMNMLISSSVLIFACAGFMTYDLISFRNVLVRNLSVDAQVTGSNSVSALMFDDPSAAERTLSAFRLAPNIVSVGVFGLDGKAFATYRRDSVTPMSFQPEMIGGKGETHWYEHRNVIVVHKIIFQGKPVGFVFIQSDMQTLVSRVEHYIAIVAVVFAVSLLVGLFLSRLARGAIAEPVIRLAQIAHAVSTEKNYAVRAIPGKEEGELAALVTTFNEMLGQIEERDRKLQNAHNELENRVEQRTAELAAANKELESFSYSVSHDLRSPLRGIDGFSQALAEDYADRLDATATGYLHRIRNATQKMGLLIDDLLNLSRVTRSQMQRETVDLSTMANAIASDLAKKDGQRGVEWFIENDVQAYGDSGLLQIVLDNLLGNAWKYTSKHEHARIEFGYTKNNGKSAYYVRDDGAGFNQEYSQRLFGAFQRLHGISEFPGTGVGLATVSRIIHRHGGSVWAEGEVEKGATFYFTL